MFNQRWDESPNDQITHEFIPDVKFVSTHERFFPGLFITYLLTGHGSMNSFLFKRTLCNTSECLCGAPVEDAKHIMLQCVIYHYLRNLSVCGLRRESGVFDVSLALSTFETYES